MIYRIIQVNTKEYEQLNIESLIESALVVDLVVVCSTEAGEVIGYACFGKINEHMVRLLHIKVVSSYQRKGIGTQLLCIGASWYEEKGMDDIYVISEKRKCKGFLASVGLKISAKGEIYSYWLGKLKKQEGLHSDEIKFFKDYEEAENNINFIWEYPIITKAIDYSKSVFYVSENILFGALICEMCDNGNLLIKDCFFDEDVISPTVIGQLMYCMLERLAQEGISDTNIIVRSYSGLLDVTLMSLLGKARNKHSCEEYYGELKTIFDNKEMEATIADSKNELYMSEELISQSEDISYITMKINNVTSNATYQYINRSKWTEERLQQDINIPEVEEDIYRLYYSLQEISMSNFGIYMKNWEKRYSMPKFLCEMQQEIKDATYFILDTEEILYEFYELDEDYTCATYVMDYMCGAIFASKVESDVVYIPSIYSNDKNPDQMAIPLMLCKIIMKMNETMDNNAILVIDVRSKKQYQTLSKLLGNPKKAVYRL